MKHRKSKNLAWAGAVGVLWIVGIAPVYAASVPQGFGSSVEELVKLAQKEAEPGFSLRSTSKKWPPYSTASTKNTRK